MEKWGGGGQDGWGAGHSQQEGQGVRGLGLGSGRWAGGLSWCSFWKAQVLLHGAESRSIFTVLAEFKCGSLVSGCFACELERPASLDSWDLGALSTPASGGTAPEGSDPVHWLPQVQSPLSALVIRWVCGVWSGVWALQGPPNCPSAPARCTVLPCSSTRRSRGPGCRSGRLGWELGSL